MEKPIIDATFTLQKTAGKGGWTFIMAPLDGPVSKTRFGMRKVRGFIDDYELRDFTMWSVKDKGHFLAVKSEIRKKIGKEEGDSVKVVLFSCELPEVIPEDFLACLKDEPALHDKFLKLEASQRKEIIDWIFSAKTEDAKVERIGKAMEKLEMQE